MKQAVMHTFMFKLLELPEPDTKQIEEGIEGFKSAMKFFRAHYLKDQKFMGGNSVSVGDLLAVSCLEQVIYRWFVFITLTPRKYAKCDRHKILKLIRWQIYR